MSTRAQAKSSPLRIEFSNLASAGAVVGLMLFDTAAWAEVDLPLSTSAPLLEAATDAGFSMSDGAWLLSALAAAMFLTAGAIALRLWRQRRAAGIGFVSKDSPTLSGRQDRFIKKERHSWNETDNALPGASETGAPTTSAHDSSSKPTALAPSGKTVLVADDDPEITKWLSLRLRQLGLTTIRSPDSVHALLGAHRSDPDLIILDVCMPSGSGLGVCEMLATDPQRADIPVIVLTGASDEATRKRAEQLGAHWVHKSPDAWPEIRALVCRLLELDELESDAAPSDETPKSLTSEIRPVTTTPPKPVAEVEKPKQPSCPSVSPAKATTIPSEPPRVVAVLDDSRASRDLVEQMKKAGLDVVAVEDVESGYMACYTKKPAAILLDATVPGYDPKDAVTRLREHLFLKEAMICVLLDEPDSTVDAQLKALGACRCTTKPYNAEKLVAEMSRRLALPLPVGTTQGTDRPKEALGKSASAASTQSVVMRGNPRERQTEGTHRPKVLCIDDDPDVSRSLATRLRPYGVDVLRAFSGMQGYWMGLDAQPDVIITDLKMPDGEGNYIFTRFKSHPLTKDTPVIVLTGYANPGHKREMLSSGVANYFTKPWDFNELLAELRHHIPLPNTPVEPEASPPEPVGAAEQ
ncbi:MAG: response regulator [Pirellulales bacterium]|nr:response regulator [Pirellulales bacterium]